MKYVICKLALAAAACCTLHAYQPRPALAQADEGFKEVEALAKQQQVAEAKAAETKKAQDEAHQAYLQAKKNYEDAIRPQIDQPKVSSAVLDQLKETYKAARKTVTEKTDAATQAEKELRRIRAQMTAVAAAQKKPPAGAPTGPVPNPASSLQLRLGPTYDYVEKHLKPILDKFNGLPLPAMVRPELRTDKFEYQWKQYQDAYDSVHKPPVVVQQPPVVVQKPADVIKPKPPPVVVQQPPVDVKPKPPVTPSVVGSWTITSGYSSGQTWTFQPGGSWTWAGLSPGTWRQTGNQVEAVISHDSPNLSYTCTYRFTVQGGQAFGSFSCVVRRGGIYPTSGSITLRKQ